MIILYILQMISTNSLRELSDEQLESIYRDIIDIQRDRDIVALTMKMNDFVPFYCELCGSFIFVYDASWFGGEIYYSVVVVHDVPTPTNQSIKTAFVPSRRYDGFAHIDRSTFESKFTEVTRQITQLVNTNHE